MQTEINYQQLGERIREKRKTMNVQQKDMAIAIGTATNHLSDIERGSPNFNFTFFKNLFCFHILK